jgi:hypothetical protein
MKFLIPCLSIVTALAYSMPSSAACPSFTAGTYTCSNSVNSNSSQITIASGQDSSGNDAISFTANGQSSMLTCDNTSASQTVCDAAQRASSPDAAAQCDAQVGAGNQVQVSVVSAVSDLAIQYNLTMSVSPIAGGASSVTSLSIGIDKLSASQLQVLLNTEQSSSSPASLSLNCSL